MRNQARIRLGPRRTRASSADSVSPFSVTSIGIPNTQYGDLDEEEIESKPLFTSSLDQISEIPNRSKSPKRYKRSEPSDTSLTNLEILSLASTPPPPTPEGCLSSSSISSLEEKPFWSSWPVRVILSSVFFAILLRRKFPIQAAAFYLCYKIIKHLNKWFNFFTSEHDYRQAALYRRGFLSFLMNQSDRALNGNYYKVMAGYFVHNVHRPDKVAIAATLRDRVRRMNLTAINELEDRTTTST